jgi:hypothetical protein
LIGRPGKKKDSSKKVSGVRCQEKKRFQVSGVRFQDWWKCQVSDFSCQDKWEVSGRIGE